MNRAGARTTTTFTSPLDPGAVTAEDLKYIEEISALLGTLNDPQAGADKLAQHVDRIQVLKVRIARRFLRVHPRGSLAGTAQQIALLGNRQLEAVLFELLEDIISLPPASGPR